jgi:hypothetical protein
MGFAPAAAATTPPTAAARLARINNQEGNENVSVIGSEQCDYSRSAAKFTGENNP